MFPTAFTHGITQFARSLSLPERLQHSPARNLALEPLRRRNTAMDSLFYDVKVVSAEEAFYISSCLSAEGAILIVPPSGGAPLSLFDTMDDFIQGGGARVDTLAVAGVGSSALGAAALGRNIADATGKPVAVVVSGYGLADVVTEALGGYSLFGHLHSVRHAFEQLDELFGRPQFGVATRLSSESLCKRSLDTQTLRAMLSHPRLSFRLLVGHSKGNLVIAEALSDLVQTDVARAKQLAETVKIVTFSARPSLPESFHDVVEVMGEWDWFGEINSRQPGAKHAVVPKAMHHTNTELPNHLPVTSVLSSILKEQASVEAAPLKLAEPVAEVVEVLELQAQPAAQAVPPLAEVQAEPPVEAGLELSATAEPQAESVMAETRSESAPDAESTQEPAEVPAEIIAEAPASIMTDAAAETPAEEPAPAIAPPITAAPAKPKFPAPRGRRGKRR